MIYASSVASSSRSQQGILPVDSWTEKGILCFDVGNPSVSPNSRRSDRSQIFLTVINGVAGQFGEQIEGTKGKFREGREISGQLAAWRSPILVEEAAASRARSQGLRWLREREREGEREIERGSREEWSDRDTAEKK